ncbi:MAG: hypothetical protein KAQ96_13705, partial [Thermoplasmata archaeon]|nr:hypothetical protein [Thermoplasmata archaeon]
MRHPLMRVAFTLVVVITILPISGCLEGDEDPLDHGPPPRLPERAELGLEGGYMTSLDEWFANVSVHYVWDEEAYRVDKIGFFDCFHPVGSSDGPYYLYFDQDEDGYISNGDFIHFFNLTNYHYDRGFNISAQDDIVAYFVLSWDKAKQYNYLVLASAVNESESTPGFCTVEIPLRVRIAGLRLRIDEFNFGYLTRDGVALSSLEMVYEDADADG